MLVLTRKIGEAVTIGSEITIKVVSVEGNKVRLGIEAPEWIKVWRSEVLTSLNAPVPEESPATAQQ